MVSTHFESLTFAQVQTLGDTAAYRTSWLDKLPAYVHDNLATQMLLLGVIDVTKSRPATLRLITSQISETVPPNEPVARKGDSDGKDQHPTFIRVDYDVALALQASTIYACDVIAERAQSLQGNTKGRDEDGINAAGISAWFFHKGRLASRDGLSRTIVSTVS